MEGFWLVSYVALWLFMVVIGCIVLALARQIGILHARLGPVGARMINAGPEIGDAAPSIKAIDIAGRSVTLGAQRGKRTLLLFLSPGCPRCGELLPALRTWHHTESNDLEIVLVSQEPDREANEAFIAQHQLTAIPFVISQDLGVQYHIGIIPYAVLVDRLGRVRAKGLVNNAPHLESLLNAEEIGHPSVQSAIGVRQQVANGPIELRSDARHP